MNWKRCSFSKHYKSVMIDGTDPERLINSCLIRNINLKKIKIISENKISCDVSLVDYGRLKELAGGRYRIKTTGEYGYLYRMNRFKKKKILLAGLLIFTGIIIYQSLFISEIEVLGYESLNEQQLRASMKKAGFYEGCRKNIDLEKVKLAVYEDFDKIAWIGIKYKGNLAQITVVETEYLYEKNRVNNTSPCNIVAAASGYISSIDPEEGIRTVDDGAYVKEGDVIISGEVPLEKTTYEEGTENESVTYVHAVGKVDAKIPVRLNYCVEASEYIKKKTGKKMITVSLNDRTLLRELCPYELASVKSNVLINWIRPVKMKLQVNTVEEVKLQQRKIPEKEIKKMLLNEIHKFVKEKLPDNAQILNKSLNFRQEKNIIYIGVTLETLQEIGKEEEIIVDKSNRQSDQNGDQ